MVTACSCVVGSVRIFLKIKVIILVNLDVNSNLSKDDTVSRISDVVLRRTFLTSLVSLVKSLVLLFLKKSIFITLC